MSNSGESGELTLFTFTQTSVGPGQPIEGSFRESIALPAARNTGPIELM